MTYSRNRRRRMIQAGKHKPIDPVLRRYKALVRAKFLAETTAR